jgi:hypothetical protein
MIKRESFSKEHIQNLVSQSGRDPSIVERTVYAFGLLEALVRVGMPFVFKGGTCLILLLEKPQRLSTDIDIIVEPGTDIQEYLDKAAKIFPFKCVGEQERKGKNGIVKRHFKFTYDSPTYQRNFYILLDVLFEHQQYETLVRREIRNDLLLTEPNYLSVLIPDENSILADKMTAFAPHTTGILLGEDKDMEVMKQMYDVSSLLDVFSDFNAVQKTYHRIVQDEIAYRGIPQTAEDCLQDTFDAALCVACKGKYNPDEYNLYLNAARSLRHHIFAEHYSIDKAVPRAVKVMYMAACMLSGSVYEKVSDFREYIDQQTSDPRLKPLKYLRKAAPEAYAYAIKVDRILTQL